MTTGTGVRTETGKDKESGFCGHGNELLGPTWTVAIDCFL